MSYYIPQPHKCPKCGHEQNYSIDALTLPPIMLPICPVCYVEWMKANFPVMVRMENAYTLGASLLP